MKLLGRRMRRDRTNYTDFDSAPRTYNRMFRRIQRKREKEEVRKRVRDDDGLV